MKQTLTRDEVLAAIEETETEMLNRSYTHLHSSVGKAVRAVTPATLRVLKTILTERYPDES